MTTTCKVMATSPSVVNIPNQCRLYRGLSISRKVIAVGGFGLNSTARFATRWFSSTDTSSSEQQWLRAVQLRYQRLRALRRQELSGRALGRELGDGWFYKAQVFTVTFG